MKVAVYISNMHLIGGIDTFAINLCNRTGFDLIFDKANINSIRKLKNVNAYQIDYCTKEYDVLIIGTAWGRSPNNIKAKKYVQMIHAMYNAYIEFWNFKYNRLPYTTHHVCVGQNVANAFEKTTGIKCDKVIHNLLGDLPKIDKSKPDKLSFITLSRISKEKGFERMLKMAEMMKNEDYVWNIYGDTSSQYAKSIISKAQKYPELNFKGVTNTPLEEITKHSYLVQLSDTEGFPYSVYESLQCLTPVISTNYPSVHELLKDGENGYILDMELSNFDINKIKSVPLIHSFKEKSSEKDWFNFLNSIL